MVSVRRALRCALIMLVLLGARSAFAFGGCCQLVDGDAPTCVDQLSSTLCTAAAQQIGLQTAPQFYSGRICDDANRLCITPPSQYIQTFLTLPRPIDVCDLDNPIVKTVQGAQQFDYCAIMCNFSGSKLNYHTVFSSLAPKPLGENIYYPVADGHCAVLSEMGIAPSRPLLNETTTFPLDIVPIDIEWYAAVNPLPGTPGMGNGAEVFNDTALAFLHVRTAAPALRLAAGVGVAFALSAAGILRLRRRRGGITST